MIAGEHRSGSGDPWRAGGMIAGEHIIRRPGPGTQPRGRGCSVFARADGPAGPRLRPGTGRAFSQCLGRQALRLRSKQSRGRATFPARPLLWRGMSRRHTHPHTVVPVAVVRVVPVAGRTAGVAFIVVEGPATQHAAVSGRPRRPARTGQRPNYTSKPQNSPAATRLRRD